MAATKRCGLTRELTRQIARSTLRAWRRRGAVPSADELDVLVALCLAFDLPWFADELLELSRDEIVSDSVAHNALRMLSLEDKRNGA